MTAEALLQELYSSSCHGRRFLFADPRFHRPDLVELLLARGQAAQLASPDKAACLAGLAISIAECIQDDPDTTRSALVRAHCLSANSYRLAGLFDLADHALSKTVRLLAPMPRYDESHRALYCRTLALVRWEQGRLDEALSLLRQAFRLFDDAKEPAEWQTCSLLLALLHDEMGIPEGVTAAIGSFVDGWFVSSCRPWLTSRALLTFAGAALPECRLVALAALDAGVYFQSYVSDSHEQLHLFALEGRARARLGFLDEASQMIEAVRRRHLEAGSMIELTLSSLDLLALRVTAELPPGTDALLGDIESLGDAHRTTFELASDALDRFVSWDSGDEDPWTSRRVAATWYLQAHRFAGSGLAPLPFA